MGPQKKNPSCSVGQQSLYGSRTYSRGFGLSESCDYTPLYILRCDLAGVSFSRNSSYLAAQTETRSCGFCRMLRTLCRHAARRRGFCSSPRPPLLEGGGATATRSAAPAAAAAALVLGAVGYSLYARPRKVAEHDGVDATVTNWHVHSQRTVKQPRHRRCVAQEQHTRGDHVAVFSARKPCGAGGAGRKGARVPHAPPPRGLGPLAQRPRLFVGRDGEPGAVRQGVQRPAAGGTRFRPTLRHAAPCRC